MVETGTVSDLDHHGTQKTDGSFEMRSDEMVETEVKLFDNVNRNSGRATQCILSSLLQPFDNTT